MSEPIYSPDGKFMWSGSEWIPAPPKASQTLNMQDSVVGGDVIHNKTVINDGVDAVATGVMSALECLGMANKNETSAEITVIFQD